MAKTVRIFRIVTTMASFCLVGQLAAQTNASAQQPDRQLSFPEDRRVGVLELYAPDSINERTTDEAESVPAFGLVAIPAGRFVNLKVGAAQDLDFLKRLPGDALQKLEIRKRRIDKAIIDRISRFEKLQELRFDWCQFESDAFDDAAVLGDLLKLTVTSDEQSKQHQHSLATWLSRLPRIEYLYAKPALDAVAFKTIGGHPALKTITIDVDKGRQAIVFKMVQQLPSLTGLIVNVADDVSPRDLDRLAAVPNLEQLTLIGGTVDGDLLRKIAERGKIQNLRLLVIKVGDDFLGGLESAQSLEHFTLNMYPWEDNREEFAFKKQLPLTLLRLPKIKDLPDMQQLTGEVFEQIIVDHPNIETLEIDGIVDRFDVAKFAELRKLKKLKTLKISAPINDDDLSLLKGLESLEYLSLELTNVRGTGLAHLSQLPHLKRLQMMIEARTVKPDLGGLASLKQLTRCQLFGLGFTASQFYPVADCRTLRNLAMSGGEIDDSVIERIAQIPGLKRIHLFELRMTDVGAAALAKNQSLEFVTISGAITREGVKRFAALTRLTSLFVRSSRLTEADTAQLPEFFPATANLGFQVIEN